MNCDIIQKAINMIKEPMTATIGLHDKDGNIIVSAISCIKTERLDVAWFSTNTTGRKVKLLEKDNRVGICFFNDQNNISLTGTAEIVKDVDLKKDLWQDWFKNHYKGGPTDKDYCLIKETISYVKLYIDNDIANFYISEINKPQSYCGLLCDGCEWVEKENYNKCLDSKGNPFYGECKIAACAKSKGFRSCGDCDDMPCDMLYDYSFGDEENCDNPKGSRVEMLKYWKANG